MTDETAYGGLIGAFPYAFRATDSSLFRSYVAVGGLLAAFVAVLVGLALPLWVVETLGRSPVVLLSNAFLVLVGLALFAPLVAPVLLVARRRRLDRPVHPLYDAALGLAGYAYVLAAYLGLVVTAPDASEPAADGALAPLVGALNAVSPDWLGVALPVAAVVAMAGVHRLLADPGAGRAGERARG